MGLRKRCLGRCGEFVTTGSYCPACKPYGGSWSFLRSQILRRDDYRCRIQRPGCLLDATTVDHINGDPNDNRPENLQAACRPCNTAKGGIA